MDVRGQLNLGGGSRHEKGYGVDNELTGRGTRRLGDWISGICAAAEYWDLARKSLLA